VEKNIEEIYLLLRGVFTWNFLSDLAASESLSANLTVATLLDLENGPSL